MRNKIKIDKPETQRNSIEFLRWQVKNGRQKIDEIDAKKKRNKQLMIRVYLPIVIVLTILFKSEKKAIYKNLSFFL